MFASWARPLLFVSLLLAAAGAHARSIEGTVREAGTRAPVVAAWIYCLETDSETFSDENGRYLLDLGEGGALPAALTLQVDTPGYLSATVGLTPKADVQTIKRDIYLTPGGGDVGTVVRERRSQADRARGTHRISEREVNELPGTYGDPAKAIENFPGMGRVKRSQGSLFVRGAQPGDTAVYVDEFEVPDLYHFTGSTSVINIPFVESVQLVPGAFSARFGRATGGLVTLKTRKLPTDDVHGFIKADIIDGGAYVGVPLSDKAAVGVSGRRSWLDAIRWSSIALEGTGDEVQLIPTYWDYQLKLDWDVAEGHELVVFAFGSGDRELYLRDDAGGQVPFREEKDSDFARVAARYRHLLGNGFRHTVTPVVGFERRAFNRLDGLQRRERFTLDAQFREELNWRDDNTRITVGIDATARQDWVTFAGELATPPLIQYPAVDIDGQVKDQQIDKTTGRVTAAFYAEGTFEPVERLAITPGIRLDGYYYADKPELSIEPRVAASYELLEGDWGLTLKSAGGVFSRPPSPEDVVAAELYGRQLHRPEALHLQLGFEQAFGSTGSLQTTLFHVFRSRLETRSPAWPVPENPLVSPVATLGGGSSYGAEFLLRLSASRRWYGWMSYSVARHERVDGDVVGAVGYRYPSEFDTTHFLVLVGQTELLWGFRLGARGRVASGMPFTDVAFATFDADTGRYLPVFAGRGQERLDPFYALDLRVDWSWVMPWLELVLYADLVNAHSVIAAVPGLGFLNAEEDREYSYDFSETTPVRGLPLIPSAGFKITF
jgi:hypothetical protein